MTETVTLQPILEEKSGDQVHKMTRSRINPPMAWTLRRWREIFARGIPNNKVSVHLAHLKASRVGEQLPAPDFDVSSHTLLLERSYHYLPLKSPNLSDHELADMKNEQVGHRLRLKGHGNEAELKHRESYVFRLNLAAFFSSVVSNDR